MGEVWEATHEVTTKRVAIKVLNATYARQASVRERFLREARAACRVRHPNVVQVHDVVELPDGSPAMVMDLLSGESLAAKLERERTVALGELATILAPAASAVAAAHALGIVHRDLKPDNLFLERTPDGRTMVKVLDFGIAKITPGEQEQKGAALTSTGAVLGTPYYMSPEQAFGEKDLDYKSDVWSFGIIVWECLVGRRPTEADNFGQIMKTITTGGIPPLAKVAPQVPKEISDLVERMLSRERAPRPELRDVAAVLERW
jgi:serine/threonine protein kinase